MCVCVPHHPAIFTDVLQAYNEIKAAGHPFEILFASSDIDQSEFNSNIKSMPWTKLPYADPNDPNSTAKLLFSKFALKGIPSLVVLDQAGKLRLLIDIFFLCFNRHFPHDIRQVKSFPITAALIFRPAPPVCDKEY